MMTTAGIDVGAGAVKVAIVGSDAGASGRTIATAWQRIRRRDIHEVARSTFDQALALATIDEGDLDYIASTGDGDAVPFRSGHFYSMSTHARGALYLEPDAAAVLDVGALHARAIRMDGRGKVLSHRMTSQCASGTGQFLENIARYLGVPLEEVGPLSVTATRGEGVSSICAVLSETDVINMVSRGVPTNEILRGIHDSISGRLARLARAIGASGVLFVSGGLSRDEGLLQRLTEDVSGAGALTVRTHPDAVLAGALGAALLAARRHAQLEVLGRMPKGMTPPDVSAADRPETRPT